MTIKLIDHGCPKSMLPRRAHANDVGADVYALDDLLIYPESVETIGLGFGLELPIGLSAFIFPRSGLARQGINCWLPPLDPGYTGEMHAVIHNASHEAYRISVGDRIGQLIIFPAVTPAFEYSLGEERGDGAFGSTGV